MQGIRDWQLTNGITSANATRATSEDVLAWMDNIYGEPLRQCHLDIDGDGQMQAETDGYLLYRYIDDYAPQDIIDGRISPNATRTDAQSVVAFLDNTFQIGSPCHLDVDGDGIVYPGTDGNLLYRFLEGKTGGELTNGATSAQAQRSQPEEVRAWMLDTYVD